MQQLYSFIINYIVGAKCSGIIGYPEHSAVTHACRGVRAQLVQSQHLPEVLYVNLRF